MHALADPLVVQSWVAGGEDQLISCNAFAFADGRDPITFVSRKLRQWPRGTGTTSLGEVVDVEDPHVGSLPAGDADAVSVGDFHLARLVGWALVGEVVDDDAMLELLEPYRGHRYRAVRMIEMSGQGPPRRGPRYEGRDYRAM